MTDVRTESGPAVASATSVLSTATSYIEWSAVFAGAVLASAISFVLLTFGSAIGLAIAPPLLDDGSFSLWLAVAAAIWVIWVQVSSFVAGGYLAGRMRRRLADINDHEVTVRDGSHGVVVWGAGVLIGAFLATSTFTGLVSVGSQTGGAVADLASAATSEVAENGDIALDYTADALFRTNVRVGEIPESVRDEATRIILISTLRGELTLDDRDHLARIVASNTSLSENEAEARVGSVISQAEATEEAIAIAAFEAADTARRIGIILAFLTAASLLVSAAGAWWGATLGGKHRDERTDFSRWVG